MIGTDAEAKRLQRTIWTAAAAIVAVLAVYGVVQYVTYRQQMDSYREIIKQSNEMFKAAETPAVEATPQPIPDWPAPPR